MVEARDERLNLRVGKSEVAMLDALAEVDGLTASDVIRVLIRRTYAERFGDKKPKAKK